MKTIHLRIIDSNSKMHPNYVISCLALECRRRKCDNCILRFKCFTTKWFQYPLPKQLKISEELAIEVKDAMKLLEYHNNGAWLVWKSSRAKKRKGEFAKIFGG